MEKKQGEISISKLRVILLLEVDFNAINKIIFNTRLIPILEANNMISREIIGGRRGMSAIHIALNKKLLADIANKNKLPSIITSADTSNCFERVAYLMAGIICQYFELPLDYIILFFTIIQGIEIYLLTLFGIS